MPELLKGRAREIERGQKDVLKDVEKLLAIASARPDGFSDQVACFIDDEKRADARRDLMCNEPPRFGDLFGLASPSKIEDAMIRRDDHLLDRLDLFADE